MIWRADWADMICVAGLPVCFAAAAASDFSQWIGRARP